MAKKSKYHFNPISLTYEIIHIKFKDRLKKLLGFLTSGMVFSAAAVTVMFYFFPSPREKALKREIEQFKLNYEILNDRMDRAQKVIADLQQRYDNIYRLIFESETIPSSIRKAGIGGVDRYEALEGYSNSDILIETTQKLDQITSQLYVQSKSFDELFKLAKSKDLLLRSIPAIQPISAKELKFIGSYFGYRIHPIYKVKKFHEGLDFVASIGAKVYATGDGVVTQAGRNVGDGYGNKIIINHGFGYQTVYAHLSSFKVKEGQKVKRGDLIGLVGNTGLSSGPHLHYEVLRNNQNVNPVYYFFSDMEPQKFLELVEQSPDFNKAE
ncbi:MAG: M23 family metallopeptidase [Bacteroidales bacterium]|nr:M23 family metallopeptidase [Bacteroidales bacterium]